MAVNLKQLVKNPDLLTGGHRACAGCTGSNILRQIMLTAGPDTLVCASTSAIDTSTRFSVFFGRAMSNRVAYAVGYTGLGVAATRFAASTMLDLLAD